MNIEFKMYSENQDIPDSLAAIILLITFFVAVISVAAILTLKKKRNDKINQCRHKNLKWLNHDLDNAMNLKCPDCKKTLAEINF